AAVAGLGGEVGPALPVALVHTVFHRENRVAVHQGGEVVGEFAGAVDLALAGEIVLAIAVELRGGTVEGEGDVVPEAIAGIGDGLGDHLDGGLVGGQVGREADRKSTRL